MSHSEVRLDCQFIAYSAETQVRLHWRSMLLPLAYGVMDSEEALPHRSGLILTQAVLPEQVPSF